MMATGVSVNGAETGLAKNEVANLQASLLLDRQKRHPFERAIRGNQTDLPGVQKDK